MAFVIDQQFDDAQYQYDREGDVLYISFGPPVPAVSLSVEGWFVIRMVPGTFRICGVTIIGFKRLFSKVRPDLIKDLPARVERLRRAHFQARYVDETDTLTVRFEADQPAYYERFGEDMYLEKSLMGGDVLGFKLTHYTERGMALVGSVTSAVLDALFAPAGTPEGPADALARAFLDHLDLPKLLAVA